MHIQFITILPSGLHPNQPPIPLTHPPECSTHTWIRLRAAFSWVDEYRVLRWIPRFTEQKTDNGIEFTSRKFVMLYTDSESGRQLETGDSQWDKNWSMRRELADFARTLTCYMQCRSWVQHFAAIIWDWVGHTNLQQTARYQRSSCAHLNHSLLNTNK